jgi:hypothetical protein
VLGETHCRFLTSVGRQPKGKKQHNRLQLTRKETQASACVFYWAQLFMGFVCEFANECTVRCARLHGVPQDDKRKGELGELAFIFKAARFGLPVSKPYGDSLTYDLVVESGDGRMLRI